MMEAIGSNQNTSTIVLHNWTVKGTKNVSSPYMPLFQPILKTYKLEDGRLGEMICWALSRSVAFKLGSMKSLSQKGVPGDLLLKFKSW